MQKAKTIPKEFKYIPTDNFKPCMRCKRKFKASGNQKYCLSCRPIALQEMLRRSQTKYFKTEKGKQKQKEARIKYYQKKKRIQESKYTHPYTTKTSHIISNTRNDDKKIKMLSKPDNREKKNIPKKFGIIPLSREIGE